MIIKPKLLFEKSHPGFIFHGSGGWGVQDQGVSIGASGGLLCASKMACSHGRRQRTRQSHTA
jgi:hypothetical protein